GAVDVDCANRVGRCRAGDHERQVYDDVAAAECLAQRVGIANVAAAVLDLRPAVLQWVERTPRDPDHAADPRVRLEQRNQPEAKSSRGPGDGDGETSRRRRHWEPSYPIRRSK